MLKMAINNCAQSKRQVRLVFGASVMHAAFEMVGFWFLIYLLHMIGPDLRDPKSSQNHYSPDLSILCPLYQFFLLFLSKSWEFVPSNTLN